jgi:hypothetical protein
MACFRDGAAGFGWTGTAVVAFGVLAVLAVAALLPRRFHVSQDPASIVMWVDHCGASKDMIERDPALWRGKRYDDSRWAIDRLGRTWVSADVLFLIEIAANCHRGQCVVIG